MDTLDAHLARLDSRLAALAGVPSWVGHVIAENAHEAPVDPGRPHDDAVLLA